MFLLTVNRESDDICVLQLGQNTLARLHISVYARLTGLLGVVTLFV